MDNEPGIYFIRNKVNGKVYIGQAQQLRWRKSTHRGQLRRNAHYNPRLQSAWNKYGEDSFEWLNMPRPLTCLDLIEGGLIQSDDLYNLSKSPHNPSKGRKFKKDPEVTKRQADKRRGAIRNAEQRLNISNGRKGKTLGVPKSEEHKRHLSKVKRDKCNIWQQKDIIIARYTAGELMKDLAEEFGCHYTKISNIIKDND